MKVVMDKKEKRHFRRYKKRSMFNLLIGGKSFGAETVDYSADGVRLIIEDSPPIAEGTIIDLNIKEAAIHTTGEIVWLKKSKTHTRAGLKMTGPVKGSLKHHMLADILMGLQRSKLTGILGIKSGSILKKVYTKDGDMIFSASNQEADRLGDILLREKKINLEQYNHSVEVLKKTGKRQGAALVELGYLKPQELIHAVKHQVEEIIISLFGLEDGNFEFNEGPLPTNEVIILKLSAANLIYKGIKINSDIQKAKDYLNALMDATLVFSPDPLNLFQSITLDEIAKEILSYITGKTSIKDMLLLSRSNAFETLKAIYALLNTRIIDVSEGGEESVVEISAEEIIEKPDVSVPQEVIDRIENMYNSYERLGYYGVFGVKEWAAHDDIKKAYYKVAKEFHPDMHFNLESDDLKAKLNAIFSFVTQAYTTLSDPEKRKQYDKQLSHKSVRTASNEELAKEKFGEGTKKFAAHDLTQALELFGQAAYLHNSIAKYHYYYGLTLNKLGRLKEAEKAVQRALKIEPANADYLAEAGHIYLSLGFQGRAKTTFEAALKLSPAHQRAKEGIMSLEKSASG
ncbi:MAG: DUF4388 domain-containing protein [Thermodesulfovibrionales bacterium]